MKFEIGGVSFLMIRDPYDPSMIRDQYARCSDQQRTAKK